MTASIIKSTNPKWPYWAVVQTVELTKWFSTKRRATGYAKSKGLSIIKRTNHA